MMLHFPALCILRKAGNVFLAHPVTPEAVCPFSKGLPDHYNNPVRLNST